MSARDGVDVGEAFRPPAFRPPAFRPPAAVRDKLPVRKRNRLPLEVYTGRGAYSLTLATAARSRWFEDPFLVDQCLQTLKETAAACRFSVYAYCFMPDHLHLLVAGESDSADLVDFVKRFKQSTGWWFRQRYQAGGLKASPTGLWQKSYYDHALRAEESIASVAAYILGNPVRAALAVEVGQYPFAGSLVLENQANEVTECQ